MNDSDPTNDAEAPETPGLAEANRKLRSATERLRQLNEETEAPSPTPKAAAGPGGPLIA
jgi:hypothetical protein